MYRAVKFSNRINSLSSSPNSEIFELKSIPSAAEDLDESPKMLLTEDNEVMSWLEITTCTPPEVQVILHRPVTANKLLPRPRQPLKSDYVSASNTLTPFSKIRQKSLMSVHLQRSTTPPPPAVDGGKREQCLKMSVSPDVGP